MSFRISSCLAAYVLALTLLGLTGISGCNNADDDANSQSVSSASGAVDAQPQSAVNETKYELTESSVSDGVWQWESGGAGKYKWNGTSLSIDTANDATDYIRTKLPLDITNGKHSIKISGEIKFGSMSTERKGYSAAGIIMEDDKRGETLFFSGDEIWFNKNQIKCTPSETAWNSFVIRAENDNLEIEWNGEIVYDGRFRSSSKKRKMVMLGDITSSAAGSSTWKNVSVTISEL